MHSFYDISFKNTYRFDGLENKGLVVLPKHQSWMDIPLIGLTLNKAYGNHGYVIMKDSLTKILEYCGGVPIVRKKDALKQLDGTESREQKKAMILMAKKTRDYVTGIMGYILSKRDIITLYPETTRYYKRLGPINRAPLKRLLEVQKTLDEPITFLPIDVEYEDHKRFRSKVLVDIRRPIQVNSDGLDQLVEHLRNEIKLME